MDNTSEWHGKTYREYSIKHKINLLDYLIKCPECFLTHVLGDRKIKQFMDSKPERELSREWKKVGLGEQAIFHICPQCKCSWYYTGK